MRKRRKSSNDRSYFKGLIGDPFVKGKFEIEDQNTHSVPHAVPFYLASFFWLLSRVSVLLIAAGGYYFYLHRDMEGFTAFGGAIAVCLILLLISLITRKKCRCPLCRGYALVDGRSRKNDKACKLKPLSYTGTSIMKILLTRKFRCHHCGTPFDCTKKKR